MQQKETLRMERGNEQVGVRRARRNQTKAAKLVPGDLDPSATGWPGLRANLLRGCKLPHLFFRLAPLGELEGQAFRIEDTENHFEWLQLK